MKQAVKFNIQKTGFKLIELYDQCQLHNNHSTASLSAPCPAHTLHTPASFSGLSTSPITKMALKKAKRPVHHKRSRAVPPSGAQLFH